MDKKHIERTHILQLDQSDCGVACLLSVLKFYEGSHSFEFLRELSGTTKKGTTLLGLYQAANALGFTAEGCEADIQTLIDHKDPVILHIIIEGYLEHYVVCYGYDRQEGFIIGDPAKGVYFLSNNDLEKMWVSKTCLTLFPNQNFIKSETTEKSKKEYFITLIKEDYRLLVFSIVLGVFVAALGLTMSIFFQKLIDDILPFQNSNKLISGIVLLAILLLSRVGFSTLREYFLLRQSQDFNNRINGMFYNSLLHLPKLFFDTRKIGELVARLNDTQRVQQVIKTLASNLVIDILMTFISLFFLFMYSWKIGVIILFSVPVYFYIIYRNNKSIIDAQKEVMQTYAFTEGNYITSMQGITTIKNNNCQAVFNELNQTVFSFYQEKLFNLGVINIRLLWQSGLASVVFLISILIYTSVAVFNSTMKLGELMAVLGIVSSLLPSVVNLALIAIPINEAKIAFNRMYEFASLKKEKEDGELITVIDKIEIKNLSFRFAGRSQLLRDINLTLEKNKIIAIVGESGSGKSTLGQILQRFYSFEEGSIVVNDICNLFQTELKSYRNLIGVVPQEITLFNGNIIDNVVLGKSDFREDCKLFLSEYGFDLYFDQFPQGLATIIGEEGINLSGGQKQIIALARALYKRPQLLILDEATSAMDRKVEGFVLQLLEKIKLNCAVFFISHRLNILKSIADKVYVLEKGRISVSGNHDQLVKTDNFYSEFWKELNG